MQCIQRKLKLPLLQSQRPQYVTNLQVTVFGQSAGGTFIHGLLGSPLSHGLFQKAWIISGSSKMQTTWREANHQNKFIIDKTGCKTKECFIKLSAQKIVESVYPEWSYDHETSLPVKDVHTAALFVIDGKRMTTEKLRF